MFFWSKFPFVRVASFFIAGILIGVFIPGIMSVVLTALVFLLAILIYLVIKRTTLSLKFNPIYGLTISLLFLSFGYLFLASADETNSDDHIIHLDSQRHYLAKVVSSPEMRGDYLRMKVVVEAVKQEGWEYATGKVFLYIKQANGNPIGIGDKLLINGSPRRISPPLNPNEFDYRQYLALKNIYHQQFISEKQWVLFEKSTRNSIIATSVKVRNRLEEVLARYITGKEELAVAKALILGNKEDLDKPTKEVYATAGAMHVLAVSGLHVGIIYMVLLYALGQGRSGTYSAWVAIVIILALWSYAFITGLSPSVLRAVTMFSFLALANAFNRKSNSINTMAISAFILLLINPYMIMYVGFQLSYVAVIGIIIWYPIVQKWINPSNKVIRVIWQITAISLVAQLATSPLSAYYFHRFPTYFFISNLIVIPAATLVVWGGLALLVFGSIASILGMIFGLGLQFLIHAVNVSLQWVTTLPFADINDLATSVLDTFLLYGIIIFAILYLVTRKNYYYGLVAGTVLVFGVNLTYINHQNTHLKQIVFYSVNKSWAIDFIENKKYTSITDSLLNLDQDQMNYNITPYRRYHGLIATNSTVEKRLIADLGEISVWHGKKILLANPCILPEAIPDHFDFVLFKVGQSGIKCYQEQILLRKFVNDQSVGYAEHNLRSEGALIVDI